VRWWRNPAAFARRDPAGYPLHDNEYVREDCWCEQCALHYFLLTYMFEAMEPTDRALRMPGDICPPMRGTP
jgi:hypothetical protein